MAAATASADHRRRIPAPRDAGSNRADGRPPVPQHAPTCGEGLVRHCGLARPRLTHHPKVQLIAPAGCGRHSSATAAAATTVTIASASSSYRRRGPPPRDRGSIRACGCPPVHSHPPIRRVGVVRLGGLGLLSVLPPHLEAQLVAPTGHSRHGAATAVATTAVLAAATVTAAAATTIIGLRHSGHDTAGGRTPTPTPTETTTAAASVKMQPPPPPALTPQGRAARAAPPEAPFTTPAASARVRRASTTRKTARLCATEKACPGGVPVAL